MTEKFISTPFIKLDSFLKYIGFCISGAEAKDYILDGKIRVNSEVCMMRGKKLVNGDVVQTPDNQEYMVKVSDT